MKTIVESEFLNMDNLATITYVVILNVIMRSTDEIELRRNMKNIQEKYPDFNTYFDYGFGSNHMWVCEAGRKKRLIFVEF
jgi:hypothetical protein